MKPKLETGNGCGNAIGPGLTRVGEPVAFATVFISVLLHRYTRNPRQQMVRFFSKAAVNRGKGPPGLNDFTKKSSSSKDSFPKSGS
jgi:hypothetical protein